MGAKMETALTQLLGDTFIAKAEYKALHRWRYSLVDQVAKTITVDGDVSGRESLFLIDESQHLAACGDWCEGLDVEAAFMSGSALGDRLTGMLSEGTNNS